MSAAHSSVERAGDFSGDQISSSSGTECSLSSELKGCEIAANGDPRLSLQGIVAFICNLLATVQLTWIYLSWVPSYLRLEQYEQGLEKTPFQYRLLLMYPLRWAHQSHALQHAAAQLTCLHAWFPHGVRPEGIVEAPIDFLSIVVAGLVARRLYCAVSATQILVAYVYPLALVMVGATYVLYAMHRLRFIYDLPSLGFFSAGLYLIYFKRSRPAFVVLFLIATLNRETTLFLLPIYALTDMSAKDKGERNETDRPKRAGVAHQRDMMVMICLLVFYWVGWRFWVAHHFSANHWEGYSRFWLNIGILLWPTSWPQILSVFAFCGPLLLMHWRFIKDPILRRWLLVLPVWGGLMFRYGILIETRIFGEWIAYMACVTALICEEKIIGKMSSRLFVERFVEKEGSPEVVAARDDVPIYAEAV